MLDLKHILQHQHISILMCSSLAVYTCVLFTSASLDSNDTQDLVGPTAIHWVPT